MKPEIKLKRLGITARKFRDQARGRKTHWPDEIRQRATALMAEGISATKLSAATGIPVWTFWKWRSRSKPKSSVAGFRKLKVIDGQKSVVRPKSPVKVFVTTSQGSEIQGLTADEIAALIRRGVL